MASPESQSQRLDIVQALRLAALSFWRDFAPIILLGFIFLTLPALFVHLTTGPVTTPDDTNATLATLIQTFTALLGMIFGCAVTYGVMAGLAGRPLETTDFIRSGLHAARPGLIVALILGALVMFVSILLYLAQDLPGGTLMTLIVLGAAIWLIAMLSVAIPAAIAEQRQPLDAIRRSIELTRGNRGRIIGLILIAALAILPAAMIVNAVIFGPNATMERAQQILQSMTLSSPGLWIAQLFNLLVYGLLATLPAVIYAQLSGMLGRGGRMTA